MTVSEGSRIDPRLIADAKARVSVSSLVERSVKLQRAGREFRACCPFHTENTPSFYVNDDKGFYHCFGCGAHGDQLQWLIQHDGMGFTDAATTLLAEAGMGAMPEGLERAAPVQRAAPERRGDYPECVPSIEVARYIWRQQPVPAWRTPVETWLTVRGVHPGKDSPVLERLRFHPRVPTGAWPVEQQPRRFLPAMLATVRKPVLDETGECVVAFMPIGVHVTYLTHDGRAKAGPRKVFGHVAGGGVLLGEWAKETGDDAACIGANELAVAEGIETTLAFMAREEIARGVAALNLNNLQGYPLEDRGGAVPLYDARPDPARAMLCWPGEDRVAIGVDADMKPLKDRIVRERPRIPAVKRDLSGAERADLCASLSSAAWRRTGARVNVGRPPQGQDFNDMAMEGA